MHFYEFHPKGWRATNTAAFTNTSGQYVYTTAPLTSGAQNQTYTRFYFRYSSLSGSTAIVMARDINGNSLWEVDYDAGRRGIDINFWNGARTRYDLYSNYSLRPAATCIAPFMPHCALTSG